MEKQYTPDDSPQSEPVVSRGELQLLLVAFLILLISASALTLSPMVRIGGWQTGFEPSYFIPLAAWCAAAGGLHYWLRRMLPLHDPVLLPAVMLLAGWGLLVIWRLAPGAGVRQTIWLLLAAATAAIIIRFASRIRILQEYRLLWLTTGLLLTGLTLLFGTNPSGAEPKLWFRLLGVYVQPSEPLRLILVMYLAAYFASRPDFHWDLKPGNLGTITPVILIYALSISLLILQRDLGTAILFAGVLTLMLYLVTRRWQIFIAAGAVLLIVGILGFLLYDVVRIRIEAWILPWQDPSGTSYQIVQALIAFASGGLTGTGPGLGSPGFVPAAHTDFLYTAIGEEYGFLGIFLLLAIYLVFLSRGLKIAARQKDPFSRMLASGIMITIGLQALLIMGGNVRLLPLTGVTLPFLSYGGSSLLTSFAAFGLLVSLSGQPKSTHTEREYTHVQLIFFSGFFLLLVFTGWWSVVRSPALLAREDNYRGFVESRFQERGAILDRSGRVLVSTIGEAGGFTRSAPYPSFAPLVGYDSNQLGQSGLEMSLDPYLRGLYSYSEADLIWSYLLDSTSPGGLDVRLTLDRGFQETVFALINGRPGAVVYLDSASGDLKALVSSPAFNSDMLEEDWELISQRDDAPLLNRPVQGSYQPGTALVPLLFAWQIEINQALPVDPSLDYSETVFLNEMELNCSRSISASSDDLTAAVYAGCPSAAVQLGSWLGEENMTQAFDAFGLTSALELRLPPGQLEAPEPAEQLRSLEETAAGQGSLTISPLRLARAAAALQTGSLPSLRLLEAVHLPDGTLERMEPIGSSSPILSSETVEAIQSAYYLNQNHQLCFSSQALTGIEMDSLAWTTCLVQGPEPAVLVVLLEDALPSESLELAYSILSQAALNIP